MASYLPQEILSLIAQHAAREEDKLTPYTLINRSWQAAFEEQIYASIVVLSPSNASFITVNPEERHKKRGLSLGWLDELTTGSWRQARRTYVRRILYRVTVPYWLSDGREKDEDYTYDNVCRRQNNSAFS
jgi:hypothetical protein